MSIPKILSYDFAQSGAAPARVDWRIHSQRSALLVHDMQDYFLNFYERSDGEFRQFLDRLEGLIGTCRTLGLPIIYTAQPGEQSPAERGLLQDFWGQGLVGQPEVTAIYGAIAPQDGDLVLTKWRYSAFKRSTLLAELKRRTIDQLVICGVYAHIGCLQTAAEAFMLDIQPFLVSDAVADFSAAQHKMALDYVASCCGVVVSTAEAKAQLSGSSTSSATTTSTSSASAREGHSL